MNDRLERRLLGIGLAAWALGFNAIFAWLGAVFDYPDILRRPPGEVLTAFTAGGPGLIVIWYGFTLCAALFVPLGILLARREQTGLGGWHQTAVLLAVLAGTVQAIGLSRWVFAVPVLADAHARGDAGAATAFLAMHQVLGTGLGEHAGQFLTAAWTALFAVVQWRTRRPWLGAAGMLAALLILAGLPEHLSTVLPVPGAEWIGLSTVVGYVVFSLWLLAMGIGLVRARTATGLGSSASPPTSAIG